MKKKLLYLLAFVCQVFGVLLISIFAHEGTHYLMLKDPSQVCLVFGSGSHFFYVAGVGNYRVFYYEFWAFVVQAVVALVLSVFVVIFWLNQLKD